MNESTIKRQVTHDMKAAAIWEQTLTEKQRKLFLARIKNYIRTYGATERYQLAQIGGCWLGEELDRSALPEATMKIIFKHAITKENGFEHIEYYECQDCERKFDKIEWSVLNGYSEEVHSYCVAIKDERKRKYGRYAKKITEADNIVRPNVIVQKTCFPTKKRRWEKHHLIQIIWTVDKPASPSKIKPLWWNVQEARMDKDAVFEIVNNYVPYGFQELLEAEKNGYITESLLDHYSVIILRQLCEKNGWRTKRNIGNVNYKKVKERTKPQLIKYILNQINQIHLKEIEQNQEIIN